MKLFAILSTLSCVLLAAAEPPVPGNNYLPPRNTLQAPSNNYLPPSTSYGVPAAPSYQQQQQQQPQRPSSNYGAPSAIAARPSQQYGAPSAPSQQYGAPSAPSQQYGAPSGPNYDVPSAPSQQYGAPNNNNNNNYASTPSSNYGAPAQTDAIFKPQSSYGPPATGYADSNNGGYSGSNNGYDANAQAEPAKYSFEYKVLDYPSGNDFGHMESRDGAKTTGRYYVLLPDGRKQIVTYEADENGYRPTITYEETNQGGNGNNGGNNGNNGYPASNGYNNNGQFNGY